MAASFWPATKAWAAGRGSRLTTLTSFTDRPFFFRNQASVKYGAVPGARGGDGLALQVGDLRDVVAHDHAVGAVALVELEDLRGRDAVGVPDDPGLDRRRRALHVARGDRQVAVLLRDLLDRHVEAVLLEDAGLLGERQRREAGPARHADRDLGFLGRGRRERGTGEARERDERSRSQQ